MARTTFTPEMEAHYAQLKAERDLRYEATKDLPREEPIVSTRGPIINRYNLPRSTTKRGWR